MNARSRKAILLAFAGFSGCLQADIFPASRQSFLGLLETRNPKYLSLGGAEAAMAERGDALDENPAGLGLNAASELGLGHILLFQDATLEQFRLSHAMGAASGYGLQFNYLNGGAFERRDDNGQLLAGTFQPWGMSFKAGLGRQIGSQFSLGASLGYLQQSIATQVQRGFDFGLGGLFRPVPAWSVAAGIKNLGGGAGDNPLPTTGYLGTAFTGTFSANEELILSGQGDVSFSGISGLGFGAEYCWKRAYSLRVGYQIPFEEQTLEGLKGLGAGLGASLFSWHLDYGILFQGDLGMLQGLTLSYRLAKAAAVASSPQRDLLGQARSLQLQGQNDAAIKRYVEYLKNNRQDKKAWIEAGKLYNLMKRPDEANNCFRWALSIDPNDTEVKSLIEHLTGLQ